FEIKWFWYGLPRNPERRGLHSAAVPPGGAPSREFSLEFLVWRAGFGVVRVPGAARETAKRRALDVSCLRSLSSPPPTRAEGMFRNPARGLLRTAGDMDNPT